MGVVPVGAALADRELVREGRARRDRREADSAGRRPCPGARARRASGSRSPRASPLLHADAGGVALGEPQRRPGMPPLTVSASAALPAMSTVRRSMREVVLPGRGAGRGRRCVHGQGQKGDRRNKELRCHRVDHTACFPWLATPDPPGAAPPTGSPNPRVTRGSGESRSPACSVVEMPPLLLDPRVRTDRGQLPSWRWRRCCGNLPPWPSGGGATSGVEGHETVGAGRAVGARSDRPLRGIRRARPSRSTKSLARLAGNERLRDLWTALAADEREHRAYWLRLKELCAAGGAPEMFDEPRRYVDELRALLARLDHLAGVAPPGEPGPPGVHPRAEARVPAAAPGHRDALSLSPGAAGGGLPERHLRPAPGQAAERADGPRPAAPGAGPARRGHRAALEKDRRERLARRDRPAHGDAQPAGAVHRLEAARLPGPAREEGRGRHDPRALQPQADQPAVRAPGRRRDARRRRVRRSRRGCAARTPSAGSAATTSSPS